MNRRSFFQKLGLLGIGVAATAVSASPMPQITEQQMLVEFFEAQLDRLDSGKDIDVRSLMMNLRRAPAGIQYHYLRNFILHSYKKHTSVQMKLYDAIVAEKGMYVNVAEWLGFKIKGINI